MAITETTIANRALRRLGQVPLAGDVDDTSDTSKARKICDDAYETVRNEIIRSYPWRCLMKRAQLTADTITSITQSVNARVTAAGHRFEVGDLVYIDGVVGMTEVNGITHTVTAISAGVWFELATDSFTYNAYVSGGTAKIKPLFGYDQGFRIPADCFRILEIAESRRNWVVEGDVLYSDEGETLDVRYTGHPKARTASDPDDQKYDAMLVSVMAARLAVEIAEELTQSTSKRELAEREFAQILMMAKGSDAMESSAQEFEEDDWVLVRHKR